MSVQSVNQHSTSKQSEPIINAASIKQEKFESSRTTVSNSQTVAIQPKPTAPAEPVQQQSAPAASNEITFTCASCQFQTGEETEFMKHARTDHRTDLSMWCKQCGKCFSNAGVLVSHIKEKACIKEEMIYKCGVKDCIFETTSGQTFVHHLRHCHKGSPFIFCVHCQKIFTLPHCLILHMQDDCPFKDRNRRNPTGGGSANSQPPPAPKPTPVVSQPKVVSPAVSLASIRPPTPTAGGMRQLAPRGIGSIVPSGIVRTPSLLPSSRGRGRSRGGRGRGRGRTTRFSDDSSDSDDPDDPSWRPEETLGETGLRRSGRWAKKINDVMNPEPSTSGVITTSTKKSFTSAEINSKMINCPSCDFMAAFQSVLEDHYIATHKVPNKNACLICHLKFENTRAFLDHFEDHRKGTLPTPPPAEATNEVAPKPTTPNPTSVNTEIITQNASTPVTTETTNKSQETEPFDGVLTSIDGAKITDPVAKDKAMKIPYQAAIHDKNLKDSKLKKFEELKSPNDLIMMKTIQKLKHFFKCGLYGCSFTTHNKQEFSEHLKNRHDGKRFHCCYCLKEELNSDNMANHIVIKHHKRVYQCSKCFYRAHSKAHVQIHIKNGHTQDPYTEILICDPVELPDIPKNEEANADEHLNTTWPYICAIGQCDYRTYDPKEFKKHNETVHRTVTVFFCHYCKVDFLTFKRLMNHYRLHGLNVFQCNYCIHGAETKEEILLHLCNAHSDEPLKAYMRGSEEEASSEVQQLNTGAREECNERNMSEMVSHQNLTSTENSSSVKEKLFTGCENELYHIIDNVCYPKHMLSLCFPRYLKNLMSDVICGVPFCNEKFSTIHDYINHLRNVHDALNFPCPNCPEMCDSWEEFKNHLLCHGSKLYACGSTNCEYYDWSKDKVKDHKKGHGDSDVISIGIREFTSSADENKLGSLSIDIELPEVKETFTCIYCKYKCSDRSIMKNHMYKEIAYQRFDCSLCEKKCLSRQEIKDHFIKTHPNMNILCSADYNIEIESMVRLILTEQDKFVNVKLTETCDMCCRKFKNPLRLQSHLYICLQKEYRPYECRHCNKGFVSLLALKYHTDEHHSPKPIDFSLVSNAAIEEDIEKNLSKVRVKQLRDVFEENKIELSSDEKSYKVKFYTCSDCAYEAYHKFNVQKHNEEKHEGKGRVMKGRETNVNSNSSHLDENSNDDSFSGKNLVKRFSCGYCVKKMLTIQEVEKHIRKSHTAKQKDFFYYYSPDTSSGFSVPDNDIYECAYCKSTKENLFSLKKHADLMHSEMEFKVRGFISGFQSRNSYLACGYCYMKVDNQSQLQEHSASSHPLLALKSIGEFQMNKSSKRSHESSSDDFPNKRIKFNTAVYVCSHCGGAFTSVDSVTAHSKKAHSRSEVQYKKMEQSAIGAESSDCKFFKCEFCKFTSEKHFLDKHLATKHKMRVTCSHCNKRFEFASKLKEHHDVAHKDLPMKYSQETINLSTTSGDSSVENNKSEDKNKNKNAVIPEKLSHYGKKPDPVDLNSLTINMKLNGGESADLPLVYVTERFNMFPKVILKDVMKTNLN